jgi:hypothetical protein
MREDIRETVGLVLVAASMIFVGFQIRQSNVQARAAAYQALGIAVSEYHQNVSQLELALEAEAGTPELLRAWSVDDWMVFQANRIASLRLAETLHAQVEQGLLPAEAVERLGYGPVLAEWLRSPAQACIWPLLASYVSGAVRDRVEQLPPAERSECPIDDDPFSRGVDRTMVPRPSGG